MCSTPSTYKPTEISSNSLAAISLCFILCLVKMFFRGGDSARYSDEEWSGAEEAKHREEHVEDQERRQGRPRGGGSGSGERGGSAGRRRGK